MTFNEYQKLAARTMPGARTPTDNLLMCALGLVGETGEVVEIVKKVHYHGQTLKAREEDIEKEIGDVLWYIAGTYTSLGEPVSHDDIKKCQARAQIREEERSPNRSVVNEVLDLARLVSIVSRRIAMHSSLSICAHDRDMLVWGLEEATDALSRVATALGIDMERVATRNIDKLRARYPDGFEEKEHNGQ